MPRLYALYCCLQSRRRSFRDFLALIPGGTGLISSKADPDLWMKSGVKANRDPVYIQVRHIVHQNQRLPRTLGQSFALKPGSINKPSTYLGVDVLIGVLRLICKKGWIDFLTLVSLSHYFVSAQGLHLGQVFHIHHRQWYSMIHYPF